MKRRRRLRRTLQWVLAAFLLGTLLVFAIYFLPVLRDPEPGFVARRGTLVEARETDEFTRYGAVFRDYTLVSDSGLQVEINVRRPLRASEPRPLVLLLGGHRTGRKATELIDSEQNFVIASLNYVYGGSEDLSGGGLLVNIPHIRRAFRDVPPAVLLTLDYLLDQPYVDARQVELVGVSLGAFFVAIPGALDERVTRVWLMQGAGDPRAQLVSRLEGSVASPWWRSRIAGLIATLVDAHHLAPERWVGRISPRPVIAVNSRRDVAFPPSTVETLHDAIREPREILWLEGRHVKPNRRDVIRQLVELMLSRVEQAAP